MSVKLFNSRFIDIHLNGNHTVILQSKNRIHLKEVVFYGEIDGCTMMIFIPMSC